jgi:hypothetical protein
MPLYIFPNQILNSCCGINHFLRKCKHFWIQENGILEIINWKIFADILGETTFMPEEEI